MQACHAAAMARAVRARAVSTMSRSAPALRRPVDACAGYRLDTCAQRSAEFSASASSRMVSPQRRNPPPLPATGVLLDTRVEAGALQFVLACTGPGSAHTVRVRFSRAIRDLAGERVNDNPLYTQLEFLAPGREVALLVDSIAGYLKRRQPLRFDVRIDWRDDAGQACRRSLSHDLGAWTRLRQRL